MGLELPGGMNSPSGLESLLSMMSNDIVNLGNQATFLNLRLQVLMNVLLKKNIVTKEELEEEHKVLVEEFRKQMLASKLVTPTGQTIPAGNGKPADKPDDNNPPPPLATA